MKLEKGKYYIGKTRNPRFRIENHFQYNGSQWTKIYRPIKVVELIPNCDNYDEDKITLQYMNRYGINNVRGGSFVSVRLDKSTLHTLLQMNRGVNDKCFICGKKGHFAKHCKENELDDSDDDDSYDDESYDDESEYEEVWCCQYCHKEFETKKGALYHENFYCKKKDGRYHIH